VACAGFCAGPAEVPVGVQPVSGSRSRTHAGTKNARRMEKPDRLNLDGITLGTMPMIVYDLEATQDNWLDTALTRLF
jgi:hypothetical protein